MSSRTLHAANADELAGVWPAVQAAHLFESREKFESFYAEAPWRVQGTGRGEAVVLERWRSHLDVLAVRGLWASASRVPDLIDGVARIASRQGFGRVLSPLVSEEVAAEYVRAGMERHSAIVALKYDRHTMAPPTAGTPEGVVLRRALPDDLGQIILLDARCFDEFWRYDADRLARHFVEDRILVAEEADEVIGYTLSTLVRDCGTVGRLAVEPSARGRGVGAALLAEALRYLVRTGVGSVTLCTQEENRASRELYRRMGLIELSGRLVFLVRSAADCRE